ncbi:MAG: penicillin-binding protein [Desulfarculus sp.]|nr:MAG: penicillin-binding protein [Desulfarculus sp.]
MTRSQAQEAKRWLRLRLRVAGFAFVLICGVLAGRALDLQVWQREFLQQKALKEIMRQVQIPPRRGVIYDRNQQELALSLDTDSVYARPVAIPHPQKTGRALAKALRLPAAEVIGRLRSEKGFVWLARRVNPEQAEAVRVLDLEGVGLVKEPRRFYPYTDLACHLLGFAGADARGLEGLEQAYDSSLRGQALTETRLLDAKRRIFHLSGRAIANLPEGLHLIMTIDKGLQYQVEKILAATVRRWRAQGGQAVVMVPQTGEILAMASLPAFNPNVYQRYPRQSYRNRSITDVFEPGSTFKLFLAAAALSSRRVSLDERFDCENGRWRLAGRVIHDTHPHGRLNLAEIIKYSSNIGAAKVGRQVGAGDFYRALLAFGFGHATGVDLPGESGGILRPAAQWGPVGLANIAFGQGVAVTALQLTTAVAAIANNGVLMRPFVVRALVDPSGRLVKENQPQVTGRPLGGGEAQILTRMMVSVTQPGGTGTAARVRSFRVAGKTGTAQKLKPGGGYSQTDYLALFVGFLPAEDPKAALLVMIDTPQGQHYGGVVAAPAWAAMARAALETLGVPSAPPRPPLLRAQAPARPRPAPPRRNAAPAADLAQGLAPDLSGLTLRQVLALASRFGLQVRASGWGRVQTQRPAPGRPLQGKLLSVQLGLGTGGA